MTDNEEWYNNEKGIEIRDLEPDEEPTVGNRDFDNDLKRSKIDEASHCDQIEEVKEQRVIKVIHKQQMPILGIEEFYITLPYGAEIIKLAPEHNWTPAIWYSFDTRITNTPEKRKFRWITTGEAFEDDPISRLIHIDTLVLPGRDRFPQFVWHLFEIT